MNFFSKVGRHMPLDPLSQIVTPRIPSPLERDVLYGRPLRRLSYLDRLSAVQLQHRIDINGASSSLLTVRFQFDLLTLFFV